MNLPSLPIRAAQLTDLDAICHLADEIALSHSAAAPGIFLPPDAARDRAFWQAALQSEQGVVFVAVESGQLLGFVTTRMNPVTTLPFLRPRKVCSIGTIVVGQQYHRRGIGSRLIEAVQDWAQAQGAIEIRLEVFDFNPGAIALYQQAGFRIQSHIMSKSFNQEQPS